MYRHLVENSGKGTDEVVLTPHITSLLWNQCVGPQFCAKAGFSLL